MKLMIVDDSSIIRKAIEKYSSKYDLEIVGSAADGKKGIELFLQTLPDLVTLDITMPEMDGLSTLREIMRIKPDTKVIIVSAQSDKSTVLAALEEGAVDFIAKPFNEEKLCAVLSKVIEGGA